MRKIGFKEKWIKLIMEYVNSVSYYVIVNGKPGDIIYPTRGLR